MMSIKDVDFWTLEYGSEVTFSLLGSVPLIRYEFVVVIKSAG